MTAHTRKGATRQDAVPAAIRAQLNTGTLETATLAEGLAIDMRALLAASVPELDTAQIDFNVGIAQRMRTIGAALTAQLGLDHSVHLLRHPSDTVRGWAAFMLSAADLALAELLERLRPLADDHHFGVREWAWLAVRPQIVAAPLVALELLREWVAAEEANVRRFAVESTRPCGVWCPHIPLFKQQPELGFELLEPLRAEPERYVQTSVGNWLNDASKTQPAAVTALCARWDAASPGPATRWITRHALRTVRKAQS